MVFNMKYEHELVSENKMLKISNACGSITDNFRKSIDINPQFESEIDKLYRKTLLNFAKTAVCMFHLRYIEMFESLAENPSEKVIEFSNSLLDVINSFFKKLESDIDISNEKDLEELRYILEISLIMMDGVIEDDDVELAYESFFQIERRLKKANLYAA